ncbi:hypothetical protein BJ508DRAFT_325002 [Ascobolus immersus RN42]|uniref:F-box domain-containing protein n=1 Tax=Ascobolus immersus RN42 TaxID=1160509 RepID=A0A3N4I9U0_ASCIM|nr:hypothetical protein BJ508DRAFT_325002 [Ascobolus immersus RN42]
MARANFLSLPTELRLEIYTHCTAFTLLQVSHTSRILYHEVNNYPGIVERSFGYWFPNKLYWLFARFVVADKRMFYCSRADPDYGSRFPGAFNVNLVAKLDESTPEESSLFQNQYGYLFVEIPSRTVRQASNDFRRTMHLPV